MWYVLLDSLLYKKISIHSHLRPRLFWFEKNDEIEVAADCNKLKHLMIDPACDPTPFSLQYLKMCTDNFTSPVLGQGAFGTVFLGSDKEIGTNIAVKRIPLHIPDKELCTKIISSFSSELAVRSFWSQENVTFSTALRLM
jgi:hypothetical protein